MARRLLTLLGLLAAGKRPGLPLGAEPNPFLGVCACCHRAAAPPCADSGGSRPRRAGGAGERGPG